MEKGLANVAVDVVNRIASGLIKAEPVKCRFCQSARIYRYGHNRVGEQRYLCRDCHKVFMDTDSLPKMRVSVKHLGDILGQYYGGMSFKELRRQFEQQNQESLSRSSFHRWVNYFSKLAVDETRRHNPKVGNAWLADECVLKVGGENIWCWDIIDSDTRFLLATHLSRTRTTKDAQRLMEKAAKVAGKPPKVVITDSLRSYIDGVELTFGGDTKHIQSQPFAESDLSTNKIERWHSTLRTRMGIMRGLKSLETARTLLDGWLVHYNYFRPHESLNDKPPAEVAGVRLPFKDWLGVVENQRVVIQPERVESHNQPVYRVVHKPKRKRGYKPHYASSLGEVRG